MPGCKNEPCGAETTQNLQAMDEDPPVPHQSEQGDNPVVQKLDTSDNNSKYETFFEFHQIKHKRVSEVESYACKSCSFKTKYRSSFVRHKLQHNYRYKCETCNNYETKYPLDFARHQEEHKTEAGAQTYDSDTTILASTYDHAAEIHQVTDGDIREVQMDKPDFAQHREEHKADTTAQTYEAVTPCCTSTYAVANAEDVPGEKMYNCDKCKFTTKSQEEHKADSGARMYEGGTLGGVGTYVHTVPIREDISVRKYNCDKCNFETKYKATFIRHKSKHANDAKGKQKTKHAPEQHQEGHKTEAGAETYDLDTTIYASTYEHAVAIRQITNGDIREVQMDKPDFVRHPDERKADSVAQTYEVVVPRCANMYEVVIPRCASTYAAAGPEDVPGEQTVNCDNCKFSTKTQEEHKAGSGVHMYEGGGSTYVHAVAVREDISVRKYNCDKCNFETRYKKYLIRHKSEHENDAKGKVYKCDICKFRTKYMTSLTFHQLGHKNDSETKPNKRTKNSRKVENREDVEQRKPVQEKESEVQVFKCDSCTYETKQMVSFTYHQLTHKYNPDVSEVNTQN